MSSGKSQKKPTKASAAKRGTSSKPRSLHAKGTRSKQPPVRRPFREFLLSALSLSGILIGIALTVVAVGVYVACLKVSDVLERIGEYKYSEQIAHLEDVDTFFDDLNPQLFKVSHDRPQIVEGRTTYYWQVHVLGTEEVREFEWEHILAQREVNPLSGPALFLDIELGFLNASDAPRFHKRGDVQNGGFEFAPGDPVLFAIIRQDLNELNLEDLALETPDRPDSPVMAPLITPDEAEERQDVGEEIAEEEGAEGQLAEGAEEAEATEVETGAESENPPVQADEPPVIQ